MNFVALKKNMEIVFDSIKSKTDEGALPSLEDVNQFVRLTGLLQLQAKEQWSEEAEDFAHLATQLLTAVKKSQTEDAVLIVESLDDAKAYCHRMYQV